MSFRVFCVAGANSWQMTDVLTTTRTVLCDRPGQTGKGGGMGGVDERLAETLARFAPCLGAGAEASPLVPPILMPMHLAVDAHPFQLQGPGGRFFLKLTAEDMRPMIAFDQAERASRLAGARGIGPALLAADEALGALLFAWAGAPEGRMPQRGDFDDPALLPAVLAAKRAWHASPPLGFPLDPFARLRAHHAAWVAAGPGLPAPASLPLLLAWAARIEAALAAGGIDAVPLHGENTIGNLLRQADGAVLLVDFDHAGDGDRFYDLGALSLELCSFDEEVESLVEAYLGRAEPAAVARVHLYRMVDDLLWGLWALRAQATSPRAHAIEFYKYAQNRLLRCQYWISIREFDTLLRRV